MDADLSEKIIIDTDGGIDDAMAIMLALSVDTTDVLALTCCFGNTSLDNACKNVMRTLVVCNKKNIPIYRGCSGPLLTKTADALLKRTTGSVQVHGSDGLGNCGDEYSTGELKEEETPAAVALVQLVQKYPKKITLIVIGPLTNIALAHRIEPKFTDFLKQLVIMGGNYKGIGNTTEVAEFNFYCDPESANIVLTEAVCPIVLVPLETTIEFAIDWDILKRKIVFLNKMDADFDEKIIIDTDCGIDDAMAIMLAFSTNTSNVLAFTCCFGNTSLDNACKNVMRTLVVCKKKNIPVHRGCSGPLLRKSTDAVQVHGSDGLGGYGHEYSTDELKEDETPAALALLQLVKKYPKKITLIAIGPLTNIALAHRLEPKFTGFLKQLVIMGGNYKGIGNTTEVAEFNFYCDPESANIVLTEAVCPILLVPWETTVEFAIDWDTYEELVQVNTVKGQFLKRISKYAAERGKKKGNKKFYDCDLLAVAAVLYPACIKSSIEKSVCVEYEGTYTKGLTILLKENPTAPSLRNKIRIITSFDISFLDKLRYKMLL